MSRDQIENNYDKALLKLENLLIRLAQVGKSGKETAEEKKDALICILASLELEDLVSKVK